ncbi:holin [Gordonia phage Terapin]|uniref:Membrane protein n=4 Tax=Terapinvirus terapin TaxID=2734283 RepID=A0A345MB70_9CAUD|nr:holin [Gordonia phage Terapin]AOE44843.1 hypothetical protein SEA_TERAPIN_31 [Gordonia phage Terapin]AVP43307.1 hypothetical protein PBI_DJOKOVIC_30 [Gordonia phage Djokovic]AXH67741.1 membrane protein [Gordonia phage Beyoncage]QOC56600.1 holin [Gordonia phage BiteSize]
MTVTTTKTPALIFNREPAAIQGFVMMLVALFSGFAIPVSETGQAVIQTVVGAVLFLWVAIKVRENIYPAILALTAAILPLAVHYGLELNKDEQSLILSGVSLTLAFIAGRPGLTPKVNVVEGSVVPGSIRDEAI